MWKIKPETCKLLNDLEIYRGDKCYLKVNKDCKVLKLFYNDKLKGYAFRGSIEYAVDTIVEMPNGAVGKPVQRSGIDTVVVIMDPLPSLQLSNIEVDEDFIEKIQKVLEDVQSEKIGLKEFERFSKEYFIAIFPREKYYEIILSKKGKLIYIDKGITFISKGDKSILVSRNGVIMSSGTKVFYTGVRNGHRVMVT